MSKKAVQMDMFLNGMSDSSGQPLRLYRVYFWESSGASTAKTVWSDPDKTQVIDQSSGIQLGSRGEAEIYGDGQYFVQIKTSTDVLYDSFSVIYSDGSLAGLYIDIAEDYGVTGSAIQNALNEVDPANFYTFIFRDNVFTIGQSLTFPSNVLIKGMGTASINQTSGTITINRRPEIPEIEFFTGSTNIVWGSAVQSVLPIWTAGDATADAVEFKGNQTVSGNQIVSGNQTVSGDSVFQGSVTYSVVTETANHTPSSELTVLYDATSGAITVDLPAASGLAGREYIIKKIDSSANIVTIDGNGSETVDGDPVFYLQSKNEYVRIVCTGTGWHIIGTNIDIFGVGQIVAHSVASSSGLLLCDGSNQLRSAYPRLFNMVGTAWGVGDGATTFGIPDLRDKYPRGASGSHSLGAYLGCMTKLPVSNFAGNTSSDGTHFHDSGITYNFSGVAHSYGYTSNSLNRSYPQSSTMYAISNPQGSNTSADGSHSHTFNVTAGGDAETRPNSAVVNYFIRY